MLFADSIIRWSILNLEAPYPLVAQVFACAAGIFACLAGKNLLERLDHEVREPSRRRAGLHECGAVTNGNGNSHEGGGDLGRMIFRQNDEKIL